MMRLSPKRPEKSELPEESSLLTPFHIRLVRALSAEKAAFMLIGGHAALVYGSSRTTGDMDLLVRPDRENGEKVIRAFLALGLDCGNLIPEDFEGNLVLTFGLEPDAVDIINRLKGSSYEEVSANAFRMEANPPEQMTMIRLAGVPSPYPLLRTIAIQILLNNRVAL
jgi:hypothetical protein